MGGLVNGSALIWRRVTLAKARMVAAFLILVFGGHAYAQAGRLVGRVTRTDGSPLSAATVELPDGRRLSAQVDGGSGHSGKRSPDLHFGLGKISPDTLLRVNLAWRNSAGQVVRKQIQVKPGWHTVELGS